MANLKATNYDGLWELLKDRPDGAEVRIGNNTFARWVFGKGSQPIIEIKLHNTWIVRLLPNGAIEFGTYGWNTVTTRERINQFLPGRHHLHNVKRQLHLDGQPVSEYETITLNPQGVMA